MRIAYLCLQATREGQASHAHVHEIASGLRELGHEVDLFEPDYVENPSPGILVRLRGIAGAQRALAAKLAGYDVVYIRGHALAWWLARRARRAGVPVVQECNGPYSDFWTAWPAVRLLAPLITSLARRQFRDATALIAVTPGLARWLERDTGRSEVSVVPNGADVARFAPGLARTRELPERYALFFGALAPWQGVRTALSAVLQSEWPAGVSLVVAGDGSERDIVDDAAGNDDRIVWLGVIPYAEMGAVVANSLCSLAVMDDPARASTGLSPLKLYESMAAGVPVVVSDTPGLADTVVAAECGLVVPAGDARAVAVAVVRLAADAAEASRLGANGRADAVANHSWRRRAEQTASVIESAARRS